MSRRAKRQRLNAPQPTPMRAVRIDWRAFRVPALLALTACLLYLPSWNYGFAGDDGSVILQNAWTQQGLSALPNVVSHCLYFGASPVNCGLYRPLAGAYYVVVGALVGLKPSGYHIAQILLYGLNVATVCVFFRRISRSAALPVIATLLFIAHPIHTEVVDNIKSADEMLCLEFFLLSAIAWLRYADDPSFRWAGASVGAYVLAVCSKETAVPMMVALPALWFFFRGRPAKASLIAALPFAAVGAAFVALRYVVLAGEPAAAIVAVQNNALAAATDRGVQIASALAFLMRYVRMLFWPHPLSFDYGYNAVPLQTFHDPVVWVAIALLAALAVIAIAGIRARRVEAFAVVWFAGAMVAVSNLLFLISTTFGERLLYVPSVAACLVVAHWLTRAARVADDWRFSAAVRSPMVAAPLALLVAVGSLASARRTREWRDQALLFKSDLRKYPGSARLNNYFGNLLYFEGERLAGQPDMAGIAEEDLKDSRTYLMRGLSILGQFQDMHAVLGMAEYRLKDCKTALPHLKQSLAFEAYRTSAIDMMVDCYKQLDISGGAMTLYRDLDTEGVDYPPGLFELGNDAAARGDDDASVRYFTRFIAKRPDNIAAHFNLASAFRRKNLFAESLVPANRCVDLKPTPDVAAKCLLLAADALMQMGRRDEAMLNFERARALDPTNPWIRK